MKLKKKYKEYENKLNFFINKAESGQDIFGFQSKKCLDAYTEDNLLHCWEIHHVHLSTKKDKEGIFYERSDWLLMLHQREDTLYLIDVVPHNDKHIDPHTNKKKNLTFVKQEVFRTLVKNFPHTMENWKIKGITNKFPKEMTDFEISNLRNNGVNTTVVVKGHEYFGGHGIAPNSSSIKSTRLTDKKLIMLSKWTEEIKKNHVAILNKLKIRFANFRIVVGNKGLIVFEQTSNTYLNNFSEDEYLK